eukprot:45518-Pyramimonas_sp.AAC.1
MPLGVDVMEKSRRRGFGTFAPRVALRRIIPPPQPSLGSCLAPELPPARRAIRDDLPWQRIIWRRRRR